VEEVLDLYKKDKKKLPQPTAHKNYSGKFVLRIGKELHQAIAIRAIQQGDSRNGWRSGIIPWP
jgi:predicted HicB family RNase H-like nuclease